MNEVISAMKVGAMLWKQIAAHAPELLKKLSEKSQFNKAVENYLARYTNSYGFIKPLGMTHPIPLSQIYTEVQFTTENLRHHYSKQNIEETALRDLRQKLSLSKIEQINGIEAANSFQHILVLGHPGGGKSTYLQRVGWECLRSYGITDFGYSGKPAYKHAMLPVLLELKRCRSDENASLVELLARELADCGFPESTEIVEALLTAGRLLLLLDALDEVAQERVESIIDQAQSLVRRAPECRFIISCRIAFRHNYFKNFRDVTLLDFTDSQIKHFIYNWFSSSIQKEEKIAESFLTELKKEENAATLELARSPVLLGYLCLGYQNTLQLSANRAEIYRRALDIYLQEWNALNLKRQHAKQIAPCLPHETELSMLGQIAYEALEKECFFFSKDEWIASIRRFMSDMVEKPRSFPFEEVLDNIAVRQGLVVQRTHLDWSFSHLTLQEYLAAYHVDRNGLVEDCVQKHLGENRWREVFLILAGMCPKSLLPLMIRVANERIREFSSEWDDWKRHFNTWKISEPFEGDLEMLVAIKAAALFVHLGFTGGMILTRDQNEARKLAKTLTADLMPGLAPIKRFRSLNSLAEDLAKYVITNGKFSETVSSDLLAISKERSLQMRKIKTCHLVCYLKSLLLIIHCKNAATKLPIRKEWRHVLEQMF